MKNNVYYQNMSLAKFTREIITRLFRVEAVRLTMCSNTFIWDLMS